MAAPPAALRRFGKAVLDRLAWPATFARVDIVADRRSILLMELEVIEPELFLDLAAESGQRMALAIRDDLLNLGAPHLRKATQRVR